jgi:hypothetical protein
VLGDSSSVKKSSQTSVVEAWATAVMELVNGAKTLGASILTIAYLDS